MPIRVRQCVSCEHRYDVLDMNGLVTSCDRDDDEPICPVCDEPEFRRIISQAHPAGDAGVIDYPYFDRGLGREIKSSQHRRQVCQELNVQPWDNARDDDVDYMIAEQERPVEAARARYNAAAERYQQDPDIQRHMAREKEERDDGRHPVKFAQWE